MRYPSIFPAAALLAFLSMTTASAQVSVHIGTPHLSIGINVPVLPELVPIPDMPVYYAPQTSANYFFYDGRYWVFTNDHWYASSWHNGPWDVMEPNVVPVFLLRVPVRYYRCPPDDFHGWHRELPPRWGERWGHEWERHHAGWDHWDRRTMPPRAEIPRYHQRFGGEHDSDPRHPHEFHTKNDHHRPQEPAVREHDRHQAERFPGSHHERQEPREERREDRHDERRGWRR